MQKLLFFYYQRQGKERADNLGFTLVELLVIMVIVGILVIIAIPTFTYVWNQSKVYRCVEEIRILEREILAYQINYGTLPSGLEKIKREKLRDPWGHLYVYDAIPHADKSDPYADTISKQLNNDFDLYSKGKDGLTDCKLLDKVSIDDVVRGDSGAYVGLGDKYDGL